MRVGLAGIPGETILMNRIESPGTSRGIPDLFLADPNHGGCWIELKVCRGQKVAISPLQANWLGLHAKYGIRTRIVALIPDRNEIRIWNGAIAMAVARQGLAIPGIFSDIPMIGGDPWGDVRHALFAD